MRNRRWNPALRHTVLGEPGNSAWVQRRASRCQHLWRAVDSTRSQCAKCGEIDKPKEDRA